MVGTLIADVLLVVAGGGGAGGVYVVFGSGADDVAGVGAFW